MGAFARRARELVGIAGVAARSSATTPWRAGACLGSRATFARAPPTFASRGAPPLRPGWTRGLASSAAGAADAEDRDLLQSIVKVFTVHSSPNYFMPWQNKPQRETSGSGVVVAVPVPGGVGVLTNAHVVADQTFVQVRRHGSSVKHQARVHAVGHECDLAVLTVDDPAFWVDATVAPRADDASEGAAPSAAPSAAAPKNGTAATRRVRPLPLGDVPHLQEHVTVMGFPQGGDNLSITSGVVSRVELTNYVHGAAQLLAIQLDAAINPGNSGGPAVQNGKVVGLAFQNLANADNIGYVIPTPIVRRFLEDVAVIAEGNRRDAATEPTREVWREEKNDAARNENAERALETSGGASFETHHAGFCALGVKCQATDNPALRAYYGMAKNETGVLVTHVAPLSPSRSVLRKDDVLLEIDGRKIANDGTVSFRGWERVAFDHLVSLKRPDEAVALTVRRRRVVAETSETSETSANGSENATNGKRDERDERDERASSSVTDTVVETLTVRAKPRAPLVPAHQYDRLPSFFLYAGLVFSPLTQPHLHEFGDDWFNAAPRRLCDRALNDHPTVPGEQVVLLSQVLADEINAGYQGMHDVEVRAVNGERVENLKALKRAVEKATGAFLRLDLADDRVLVVNREEAEKTHARIMAKHRVPGRMSRDLA